MERPDNTQPTNSDYRSLGYRSPQETAQLIGLKNPATLRNWRMKGKGPKFTKLTSRIVVYHIDSIRRWMASKEVTPKAPPTMSQSFGDAERPRAAARRK